MKMYVLKRRGIHTDYQQLCDADGYQNIFARVRVRERTRTHTSVLPAKKVEKRIHGLSC